MGKFRNSSQRIKIDETPELAMSDRPSSNLCDIHLSLCGQRLNKATIVEGGLTEEEMFLIFEDPEFLVEEAQYVANPQKVLSDPRLVMCIED